MSIKIAGTGRALPGLCVDNHRLSALMDTSDAWIDSHVGVRSRYICVEESLTDLCASAARKALSAAGLGPSDLDMIFCATIGGDYTTPSLACCVAERLGSACPASDINAACPGFLYALDAAAAYVESGRARNILIVAAERMSRHIDWNDRSTAVLFGDAAAACVVAPGGALRYLRLGTQGNVSPLYLPAGTGGNPFREANQPPGHLHMSGQEVFRFAVLTTERETVRALDALSLTADGVDWFLLHQANRRIIDNARVRLGQPPEKFPINIDRYANTSSATIPFLLDELLEQGRIRAGETLLMCSFGAGMTYATAVLVWEA